LEHLATECKHADAFEKMSAVTAGKTSLVLTACRCYRYPVPFHLLEGWLETSSC
jgi:hypothetical protein